MKQITFIIYVFVICTFSANAQTSQNYAILGSVHKYVENLPIQNVFNYSHKSIKLSDFKGKCVFLNFSNLRCEGCLRQVTRYDSLQVLYKDKVQFFWVVPNPVKDVEDFLSISPVGKRLNIPIIAADTLLSHRTFIYDYHTDPILFWLDPQGVVCFESSGDSHMVVKIIENFIKYYNGKSK
jgi:hypothetical protein